MWKLIIRPILFLFPPETAHSITFGLLKLICSVPGVPSLIKKLFPNTTQDRIILCGLEFKNRLGLAAGLDKNGDYVNELSLFGFSHIEIGTVTPKPQAGNDRPRLFRLPKDSALINRMGFNNDGADVISIRLSKLVKPEDLILGINIGKNKDTPLDKAWEDYLYCFEKLYPYADYFTINVSSPNTPGLRGLQEKEPLLQLIVKLHEANERKIISKPIFLKIAPDLGAEELKEIKNLAIENNVDAIIMGNTTVTRDQLNTESGMLMRIGQGGLSGLPLTQKSTEKLVILKNAEGKIPLIGVGGIMNGGDAKLRILHGADLIQIYTGFIYYGPGLIKNILKDIHGISFVPKN